MNGHNGTVTGTRTGAEAATKDLVATTVTTPVGPFTLIATDVGQVCAAGFTGDAADLLELLPARWRHAPRPFRDLGEITTAVQAYVGGDTAALGRLSVAPRPPSARPGGDFLDHAWSTLRGVPAGGTVTYAELAVRVGRPRAVRAAANACARNPVALIVPCHRVLRTGGGLGGYRWGTEVKRWLLDHERGATLR